jgi:hypothetical protein
MAGLDTDEFIAMDEMQLQNILSWALPPHIEEWNTREPDKAKAWGGFASAYNKQGSRNAGWSATIS